MEQINELDSNIKDCQTLALKEKNKKREALAQQWKNMVWAWVKILHIITNFVYLVPNSLKSALALVTGSFIIVITERN